MKKIAGLAVAALALVWTSSAKADGPTYRPAYGSPALPAVSALNAKLEGYGGEYSEESLAGVAGSVSVPLGHRYGLQLDGMAGSWNDEGMYGIGAHVFWRDPSRALLGVYADHVHWEGLGGQGVSRLAVEGELYLGQFTLEGMAGAEFGELEDRFFARTNLAMYPREDLRLFIGHRYLGGESALALGTEWQVAQRGVALFAEGQVGDDAAGAILGGVRLYLGDRDKSLIRRHREDDPTNDLKNASQSLAGNLDICPYPCKPH